MPAFKWDEHFVTGLVDVDQQHRHLVDLINTFEEMLASDTHNHDALAQIVDALSEYTVFHFTEEESLMQRSGIDEDYFAKHVNAHRMFLDEVVALKTSMGSTDGHAAAHLLNFLTHWLAYHILGEDQLMARQMALIEQGVAADQACKQALAQGHQATEPLLEALSGLFRQISQRNRELKELNETLEQKVIERTRQLENANHELEVLALTDVLTGLPNRRHAMRQLGAYWAESVKYQSPLSCMMIDADHFKEINDLYGHDQGDKVLSELSRMLVHSVRTDDLVARLGGDEFLIICPNTPLEGARVLADTLLKNVNAMVVETGEGEWRGSMSVGVATANEQMKHYEALIKLADEKVYEAKRGGKNRVAS